MPPLSCTHFFPPSRLKKSPNSVPAKRRSRSTVSSAIVQALPRAGRSAVMDVQVRPRSPLRRRYGLKSPLLWLLKAA